MGEAELVRGSNQLIIHAIIFFYGDAANEELSKQIAADIAAHWNEAEGRVVIDDIAYLLHFDIEGHYAAGLTDIDVLSNTNPRYNYFRVENFASGNISFVDGIGSNTGYFLLNNLLDNSTTAAHEFGHTLGLEHPHVLDIRGKGTPGIMYPRGTIVDPEFQYDPAIPAGLKGGTLNPFTRKVLQEDVDDLHLERLSFDNGNMAIVGDFSSVWHDRHINPGI